MDVLGNYSSSLRAYLYQELLAQLETSITAGEFAAGTLFDTNAAKVIQAQGQSFSDLTLPIAGTTAYAEDVNKPLDILQARYSAILQEISELNINVVDLLAFIRKESTLVTKAISFAEGTAWGLDQPSLSTAFRHTWCFAAGHCITTNLYPNSGYKTDPSTGVVYTSVAPQTTIVIPEGFNDVIIDGIGSPNSVRSVPIKNIQWSFIPSYLSTQFSEVYGSDRTWALLNSLEPTPLLNFGTPILEVLLPLQGISTRIFTISGFVAGGGLPTYIRILFHPRQKTYSVTNATSGQIITLSPFNITANTVQVYNETQTYQSDIDFQVNKNGELTILPTGDLVANNFDILFTEYYPAYQCSIDQSHWSPIVMLDRERPYPDDTTIFLPISIKNNSFPLTDELGVPTGLFINVINQPKEEMLLLAQPVGISVVGERAQLKIDLENVTYLNGISVAPFTNFPVTIQSILIEGFTSNTQNAVLLTPIKLDRPVTIRFPRQLVRRFIVSLSQENYSLKEYTVLASDSLRRNTLESLQSLLPFSVRRPQGALPQKLVGATYDFGLQNIAAVDITANTPGVFVSGPYTVSGFPELVRLDIDAINMSNSPITSVYWAYTAFDINNNIVDQGEVSANIGKTVVYPSSIPADHVDFYCKFVFRQELSVVEKFLLQVTVR